MNKELSPLEALKEYKKQNEYGVNVYADEYLDIIEKSLKALEIIKEKEVNVQDFKSCLDAGWGYKLCEKHCQDNDEWEETSPYRHSMTKEEFDLLEEILK